MRVINLLPKEKQQELKYEQVFKGFVKVFWLSVATFILVVLVQLGAKWYLELQITSLKASLSDLQQQVNKQDNSTIKNKITAINNVVGDFATLAAASPKWSNVIAAFSPLPPQGVQINTFVVDPKSSIVNITGFAPTRELVIQLYNNILGDTTDITGIDYPLENIAKPTNINFHFTFGFNPGLLK